MTPPSNNLPKQLDYATPPRAQVPFRLLSWCTAPVLVCAILSVAISYLAMRYGQYMEGKVVLRGTPDGLFYLFMVDKLPNCIDTAGLVLSTEALLVATIKKRLPPPWLGLIVAYGVIWLNSAVAITYFSIGAFSL